MKAGKNAKSFFLLILNKWLPLRLHFYKLKESLFLDCVKNIIMNDWIEEAKIILKRSLNPIPHELNELD
jgi:hypothetical protein